MRSGTGRQQSMRTGSGMTGSGMSVNFSRLGTSQKMTINPYREKASLRKTQYHDLKSMVLQKKLSVIDKVS